jgi:hypothetical protein
MEMNKETRDTIITSLYDKYGKGEISATQREQLIQKINDKFYTEMTAIMTEKAKVKEAEETETEDAEKPDKECDKKSNDKFDKFKEEVDKRCENGETTEDFRDQLLEKAKEKFCSNDKSE